MFVSIRGRVLVNVEALNMTESVGNYVKHRRVPVILPSGGYTAFFVPAISGESIAHGFQTVLAKIALDNNLPVCKLCSRGIFLKSTNEDVLKESFGLSSIPNTEHEIEKTVIKNCLVEDVGGFLYAPRGGGQVKRTSNFYTGYMIPVREALESTVIEPQLHTRYALGTKYVKQQGQMIYYIEMSSSVYTFSYDLDTRFIGKTTYDVNHVGETVVNDVRSRIEATLKTLQVFLTEMLFGAKRTRFLPVVEWESLIIAVANDTWTVLSPNSAGYVLDTIVKLDRINPNVKLFIYVNPDVLSETSEYVRKKTRELVESMKNIIEEWKANIKEKLPEYAEKIDWDKIVKEKLEKLISKRLSEITESKDMRYLSMVQEKYKKAIEAAKDKDNVRIYNNFIACVVDAVKEGLERL